jgi:hypothetical protein
MHRLVVPGTNHERPYSLAVSNGVFRLRELTSLIQADRKIALAVGLGSTII